jgi:NAD(P)-dependent dehydrogenase (short-subunit alcohol dehydrogenase family)
MIPIEGKTVVVIGGSSGIGLATAKAAVKLDARVIIASRNLERLKNAQLEIGSAAEAFQLDISQEEEVKAFFKQIGSFDHLTTPGGVTKSGKLFEQSTAEAKESFANKFWGQFFAVKYGAPQIKTGGSIVLISGLYSERPSASSTIPSAVNSALQGLGRALAVELAPIRVNVCCPGLIDTPRHPPEKREHFPSIAETFPARCIGQAEDVAESILHLMTNAFITGTTVYVDGGEQLVRP